MSSDDDELASEDDSFLRGVAGMRAEKSPVWLAPGAVIDGVYRIERELGAGGMGIVYRAYDLRLHRDVAIKLHLRADAAATERMRREATAMARLVHAHVITVYEIGEYEGHAFVAMEYVDGGTARTWLEDRKRSAREVLDFFLAAARGLAAAHAAGLVHRDFKPDNVLVGKDGRIRVADFGLATDAGDAGGEAHRSAGTPGYMAPEQEDGVEVGPAADQYTFCVALWEALSGMRPSLADATTQAGARGPATPPLVRGPDTPAWLVPVIARGLRVDPSQRWPSMDALIEALLADPDARRRRRWRTAGVAALAIAPAVALILLVPTGRSDPAATCRHGARAHAAGLWDAARQQQVRDAFARSQRFGAEETFARVSDALDARIGGWVDARIEACAASRVRGEQSDALLDLRMRCLDRRLGELDAVIDVLATGDAGVVDHAVAAVSRRSTLDECADADALRRAVPLPDDAEARSAIEVLEQRRDLVEAQLAAGRYTDALPDAEALARDAAAIDYAPVRARIAASRADALAAANRGADAEAAYLAALELASAARDDRLALDAWRGVIAVRVSESRMVGAELLAAGASAAAARLAPDDPARALLDQSLATLLGGQSRFPEMLEHARRAREWFGAHAPGTADEAGALQSYADGLESTGSYEEALAANGAALAILQALLGGDHPDVAHVLEDRSRLFTELSRFDEALAAVTGLIAPIERAYGAVSLPRGRLAFAIGEVDRKRGDFAAATAAYQQALDIYGKAGGSDVDRARALVALGATRSDAGFPLEGKGYLEEAAATAERALPESEQLLSGILVYLGGAVGAAGDLAGAQVHLRRALDIRSRLYGANSVMAAQVENSIGTNYSWLGDHAQAEAHLSHALAIDEAELGADAIDTLFAHHNLGTDLADQGRWADAAAHHARSAEGLERVLGAEHPVLCAPLSLLAYEYAEIGRAADGVAAAEKCHAIRAARGEPDGAYLQLGLGAALYATGQDRARARALVQAAVAELEQWPDDPAVLPRAKAWLRTHR